MSRRMSDPPISEALSFLHDALDFAYQHGLHEVGYDPVEVVSSALPALAEGEWRPIETARRGKDFLALIPWQRKHHQMVGCIAPDGKFRSWPGRIEYHPTHWMPLPPPPPPPEGGER